MPLKKRFLQISSIVQLTIADASAGEDAMMVHHRHALGALRAVVHPRGLVLLAVLAPARGVEEVASRQRELPLDVGLVDLVEFGFRSQSRQLRSRCTSLNKPAKKNFGKNDIILQNRTLPG